MRIKNHLKIFHETIAAPGMGTFGYNRKALPQLKNAIWGISFAEFYPSSFPDANDESLFMGVLDKLITGTASIGLTTWLTGTVLTSKVAGAAYYYVYDYPVVKTYPVPIPIYSTELYFCCKPFSYDSGAQIRIGLVEIEASSLERYIEGGNEP